MAALRNTFSGLRKALREGAEEGTSYLRAGRGAAIGLDLASDVELDLSLLRATSDATRLPVEASDSELRDALEELRAAAAAYRGEFLEGFSLDDAPDFEYWAGLEREGWRRCAEAEEMANFRHIYGRGGTRRNQGAFSDKEEVPGSSPGGSILKITDLQVKRSGRRRDRRILRSLSTPTRLITTLNDFGHLRFRRI